MAEYRAKLSYLHIAPRKVRAVADLIRGNIVTEATRQLEFSPKRASQPILKLLNSAVSNAKNLKDDIKEEDLLIKEILVDEGPKLKRYRPRARGSVNEIQKKTSHIILILSEKELKKEQDTRNSQHQSKARYPSSRAKLTTGHGGAGKKQTEKEKTIKKQ